MTTLHLPRAFQFSAFGLPFLFILMWSSGYPVGKLALPHAGPFTLLFLRFSAAALILLVVALVTDTRWPQRQVEYVHLAVVGLLIQVLQFFGVYSAMKLGVSAGVTALFIGTMPIFTALGASGLLAEKISTRQGLGLAAGFVGVAMVVGQKFDIGEGSPAGYVAVIAGLLGITAGTLYQKKYCASLDLRSTGFVQLSVAAAVAFLFAWISEGIEVRWTGQLLFASAWLSVINSIGAISLLYFLMRRGEASKVASLFYLIPGVTAVMAYVTLGETMGTLAMAGFAVTAGAVYLCTRG